MVSVAGGEYNEFSVRQENYPFADIRLPLTLNRRKRKVEFSANSYGFTDIAIKDLEEG